MTEQILFPTLDQRSDTDRWLMKLLQQHAPRTQNDSVTPTINMETFREQLAARDFTQPVPLKELLKWSVDCLSNGLVHMTHPRYFGLFNPAPTYAAECADRITAAFNPQICVWSHAPVAVEIENHVIRLLGERIGFKDNLGGHFTSGGAEANNTSVICALTAAHPDFSTKGATCFSGQPRLYVSKESHLAWIKIAHQSGIGRDAVRLVDTEGTGSMDAIALREMIEEDMANGDVPFMIASTAGTTNAGMIDPLESCADLAAKHNLWFHVDAAWGGAIMCSDKHRHVLNGIERADSVTIDAHKWFAVTMGAGMFITSRRPVLNDAFTVYTSYMVSHDAESDFYVNSMQWSRRFIGLRLFLGLANVGWAGYAKHIENSIDLIAYLNKQMADHGWEVANQGSSMAVSCLIPPIKSEKIVALVDQVVEEGKVWVSTAVFENRSVVRACVTNGRTTKADIDALVKALVTAA